MPRLLLLSGVLLIAVLSPNCGILAGCNCSVGGAFTGVSYAPAATVQGSQVYGMAPATVMPSAPSMVPAAPTMVPPPAPLPPMQQPLLNQPLMNQPPLVNQPSGGSYSLNPYSTGAIPPAPVSGFGTGRTDYGSMTPPPGTLGQTYRRYTRPIPYEKHPRVAMLEVFKVAEGLKLTVHGMDGFRDEEGVWHFETKKPLLPGTSNVRKVLVFDKEGFLVEDQVRSIRLIPDRIVELEY